MARSVLLAVRSPEIAEILREAAEQEDLEIWETTEPAEAVEIARREHPAIVVLEDQDDSEVLAEFAHAVGAMEKRPGGDISLIAVTATGHPPTSGDDVAITDSLEWPASAGYVRTKLRAWLLRRACQWQTAPLPHDESARLQALRDLEVLDTDPEPRFDRYTDLASSTFDVPIALITLVDEHRQWFKSRHGVEVAETPRDMSVCAYTILGDDVFQVPAAFADPRFADNPLVASGPRFRFYAGAPLTLANGTRAGTLCVVDRRPGLLDDDQLAELRRLAALVTAELEAE
jgi:CheY-like chemotaxis protein